MNILFINYDEYAGCAGVHIHFLAEAMQNQGHTCIVALTAYSQPDYFGKVSYQIVDYNEAAKLALAGKLNDTIIHIWTPRTAPQALLNFLLPIMNNPPYFVHLEDNEHSILEAKFGKPYDQLKREATPESRYEGFSHPLYFESILQQAAGITCIIDSLKDFVPKGTPYMTFWPACEKAFYQLPIIPDPKYQRQLQATSDDDTLYIVYPGGIHDANLHAFAALLTAVHRLYQEGIHIHILRCGLDYVKYTGEAFDFYRQYCTHLGDILPSKLPSILAFADMLVQPGGVGQYDHYRFPSKIPFFLASGRPTILPHENIGLHMNHGENCFLLETNSPEEIVIYLRQLAQNPELRYRMGAAGRIFARKHFNWDTSAQNVIGFYEAHI